MIRRGAGVGGSDTNRDRDGKNKNKTRRYKTNRGVKLNKHQICENAASVTMTVYQSWRWKDEEKKTPGIKIIPSSLVFIVFEHKCYLNANAFAVYYTIE